MKFNNICSGDTDVFNLLCSTDSAGRRDICEMHGITTDGHATCAGILVTPCMSDPFTNSHCNDATDISGIRTNYCGDPATAWDDDCVVATYPGTKDARDMACLQYGIDMTKGGNALCAMRPNVLEACDVESPFAHPVCDEVAGIDTGFRTTFCQIAANSFTTGCEQTTHGDVDAARDEACLMDLSTATGCVARPNVGTMCMLNPLSSVNPGCVNLPNHGDLLSSYCAVGNRATEVSGCGAEGTDVCRTDAFNPSAVSLDGTIDCLGDPTFAPDRRAACTTGVEKTRCDTAEIAPEVCKVSGASANPFVAFCTSTTNIGGGNIAQIRQTALTNCFDNTKNTDGDICQNTAVIRRELATDCLLAGAFETRCDYTQYAPQKPLFCNDQATAWNVLCDGETIGTTTAARDAACVADANADMANTGSDTRCGARPTIITACDMRDPFRHPVCNKIAGIDSGIRTPYCALTANVFKTGCKTDGTHGPVLNIRRDACLTSPAGTPANPLCLTNELAIGVCNGDPFTNTGCRNLMTFSGIVETYCTTTNPTDPQCGVKTSTWVRSFGDGKAPPARLDDTNRRRQFLAGLATGLDTTGAVSIISGANLTLTLDSARYNGEPLGGAGDASDGYGLLIDTVATNSFVVYAGLLADTDLGAPLTQTTGSVTWYGQIQIFRHGTFDTTSANDFELEITYGGTNGVAGSIEGDVERVIGGSTSQYRLAGTYDAGGVITGTTTFTRFQGTDAGQLDTAIANGTGQGILTGLIGAQGAVGVFLRAEAGSTKDNIEGAASASQIYAGGFVAAPYIPAEDDAAKRVTFRDWLRGFDYPLPTSSAVEIARTTSKPHFIRPKTDGTLDLTGVTGTTQHKATRAGDDKDGFAYGVGKIVTASTPAGIGHSFVGILPSTDLGAPLTEAIAIAKWPGQFSFGNSATLNDIEFTLTFDGTDSGTINGMFGFVRFDLDFDGKGIITGDVTYSPSGTNPTTTVARGLIGEEGLVGVFTNINNGNTTGIEFGGFVASPSTANYDAWLGDFEPSLSTTLAIRGATLLNRTRQFLAGGETELDSDKAIRDPIPIGLTFNSAMYNGAALSGDNDIKDGFAGFADVVFVTGLGANANVLYYAGLLSGTDLGRPLKETAGSITWNGQIQILRFDAIDTNPAEDFSLEITLGGTGGVAGSIEGFVQSLNAAGKAYHLAGTYDTGGIITGEVTFASFTGSLAGGDLATTTNPNGILSGLIGEQGAVGVFLAGGGTKEAITGSSGDRNAYAGGFVVSGPPPARQPVIQPADTNANQVTFNDWLRDFGSFPPPDRLTAPPRERKREFLAGDITALDTTGAVNADDTRNISANLASLGRSGDAADGYNYFFDTVAQNVHIPYAGLLSGTDLGARLTEAEGTVTWHGKLRATLNGISDTNEDLALTITYGGTGDVAGTIAGEVKAVGNSLYQLRGEYDTSGVIDGTVYYGQVNQVNLPNLVRTFPSENPNGFLTGLIGEQGAVGVFISGTGTKGAITSPSAGSYYAGGFIVAPPQ